MKHNLPQWEARYARLRARLTDLGWISEGYVQNRGPGAGGPCYQWTRKVRGKTISVALSREQYEWLREAIANWRQVQQTLKEMQRLSRQVLFSTVPHPLAARSWARKFWALSKGHSGQSAVLSQITSARESFSCAAESCKPVPSPAALAPLRLPYAASTRFAASNCRTARCFRS